MNNFETWYYIAVIIFAVTFFWHQERNNVKPTLFNLVLVNFMLVSCWFCGYSAYRILNTQ